MLGYAIRVRGRAALHLSTSAWTPGAIAGAMSLGSYWIAFWAFANAPMAMAAALRETSVLFAMAIAVLFLGERITAWRWIAAGVILCGVVAMRL